MKSSQEFHVASFICQTVPIQLESVKSQIQTVESAEIHADSDDGKIVFTLEGTSQELISCKIEQLRLIAGVITLAPVYHQYINE